MTPGLDDPQTLAAAPSDDANDKSPAATDVAEGTAWLNEALADTDPLDPETQAILDEADAVLEQEGAIKTSRSPSPSTAPAALTPDPETEAFMASLSASPVAPAETAEAASLAAPVEISPSPTPEESEKIFALETGLAAFYKSPPEIQTALKDYLAKYAGSNLLIEITSDPEEKEKLESQLTEYQRQLLASLPADARQFLKDQADFILRGQLANFMERLQIQPASSSEISADTKGQKRAAAEAARPKLSIEYPENYATNLKDNIRELEFSLTVLEGVGQKETLTDEEMQAAREAAAAVKPHLAQRLAEITDPKDLLKFLARLELTKDGQKQLKELRTRLIAAERNLAQPAAPVESPAGAPTEPQPEATPAPAVEAGPAAIHQQILHEKPSLENIATYLQTLDSADQELLRQWLELRAERDQLRGEKNTDSRIALVYNLEQKRKLLSQEAQDFLKWLLTSEDKAHISDLWTQELRRMLNPTAKSAAAPITPTDKPETPSPGTAAKPASTPEFVEVAESEAAGKMVQFEEAPVAAATGPAVVPAAPEAAPQEKKTKPEPSPAVTAELEPDALTEAESKAENDYQLLSTADQEQVKKYLRLLAGIGVMIQSLPKEEQATTNKDYRAKCKTIAGQLSQPAQEFLKTHKSVLLKNVDQRAAFLKRLKELAFDAAEIYEFLKTDGTLPPAPEPTPEPVEPASAPEPEPAAAPTETKFDINTKDEVLREAVARGESRWGKWLDRWEVTKSFLTSSTEALHSATVLAQKRRLDVRAKALKALNDKKVKALEAALAAAKKEGAAKAEASRQSAAERAKAAEDLDRRSNLFKRMRELLS